MFSVIFEVQPRPGRVDAYLALARRLRPELEAIEGFIDNERFASQTRPGWWLSHSTWRDEKALVRWRSHGEHHGVQSQGRAEVFSDYHLRVGAVIADTAPPPGSALSDARGEETAAPARFASLTEFAFGDPGAPEQRHQAIAAWLASRPAAGRTAEPDVFESSTTPGKMALLAAWTGAADARAAGSTRMALAGSWRHRVVRVVRDYGMFDRGETPQFHPLVARP